MKHEEAMQILQMYKDEMGQRIDKANAPEVKDVYQWQMDGFDMAIDALNQTAWIPVGERLPDDFEHVLVTLGNGYDGVTYDWRSNGDWYDWGKSIIAWMPLPEPYKGGEDND